MSLKNLGKKPRPVRFISGADKSAPIDKEPNIPVEQDRVKDTADTSEQVGVVNTDDSRYQKWNFGPAFKGLEDHGGK